MGRIAVVLFNLGGPDRPEAVKPFLFNLFNDPAIIGLPQPARWLLAKLISTRRAPVAREIYANIGGRSPLLPLTEAQAEALQTACEDIGEVRCFVAMRYWNPFAGETVREVAQWRPDEVLLLPLYPQFSTTTTGSSLKDWRREAEQVGFQAKTRAICCYPDETGLISAQIQLLNDKLGELAADQPYRVLFSAHGLPKKVIESGDPYQWAVERTADAIVAGMATPPADWVVCYQSRVGPLEWIGPSTESEIERAGRDGVALVVLPIAFVSEHSETLVELDIEYRELSEKAGVPAYRRVPAVATHPDFIAGLAGLVRDALSWTEDTTAGPGCARVCPGAFGRCAMADPLTPR
ncbi:MAG: ferrochelatase [Alphaproteobacteria bacterium]